MELKLVTFNAGDYIFKENTPPGGAYMITKGKVEISKDKHGQQIHLGTKIQGEIFGEMSLIDNSDRSATAQAIENTTCYLMNEHDLDEQFLDLDPFLKGVFETISKLIRQQSDKHALIQSAEKMKPELQKHNEEASKNDKFQF